MTKDQLKDKLNRYKHLTKEREQIQVQIDALADPRPVNWDGMPKAPGTGDAMAGIIEQRDKLRAQYVEQLEKITAAQAEVEGMISRLTDPRHRLIMRSHYIDGLKWEAVCTAVNYSWRHVHNFHSDALDELLEKEAENAI